MVSDANVAVFEVFHVEWPGMVFGALTFTGVTYLQLQTPSTWGYGLRIANNAAFPSRSTWDAADVIFEFFTPDGAEPSAFIVAASLEVSIE